MTIFLDADDEHWLVAQTRRELFDALMARLNPDSLDDLYRLAGAAFDCEVDAVKITEQ
ncbi:hypothetical protein ACMG4H_14070 [Corynebacterium glutamicum]|uniref:hypothetical protein n=1 Tax=Corynebacterium glutamicum TaxID=1718 RepID=UPI003C7EB6A9